MTVVGLDEGSLVPTQLTFSNAVGEKIGVTGQTLARGPHPHRPNRKHRGRTWPNKQNGDVFQTKVFASFNSH